MINIEVFKLDDEKLKSYYKSNINSDSRSITFTLNPKMYNADILSQYRAAIHEIKASKLFYYKQKGQITVHPDFEEMILVPELTETLNIHFHGYFKCNPEKAQYFYNEFRKFTYKNEVIGRQMMFKNIDNLTEALKDYPFKDISELLKFPDSKKIYIIKFSKNNIV